MAATSHSSSNQDLGEGDMNIWLINHYANSPGDPGDARHYSHARELMSRGHRVRIIACSFLHQKHESLAVATTQSWENTVREGVPFTWIQACSYEGESFKRIWNMFEFAYRTVRRNWSTELEPPDVILGSTPHPFAALAAERLAAHYKVQFLLEVRDVWPYVLTEVGGHSAYHPFVQIVDRTMRFLYSRASRIVMFSRDSTSLLQKYGADPRKIIWIPHGVDLTMCPAPRPAPDDGVFTVSYIGAHNQWNSLDTVLNAAKILQASETQGVIIRFVGDGSGKQSLVERARAEKIRNVRFEDPVPKKQIHKILHTSDAFVINNHKDEVSKNWMSFNKLYEYLAAGRPVVFGSYTENDPVRESGGGISVAADDPVALAEAIRFMASRSPQELAGYGERGRSHIERHYSIPVLVDRFEAAVNEVTSGNVVRHLELR